MSGATCLLGTRIPVYVLWDHLEGGGTIDEFLEDFEGTSRTAVIGLLRSAYSALIRELEAR
jgi:uncharacterized protein (DUF433 family)